MAKSLSKDRLAGLQNKSGEHFANITTKVTDKTILKNDTSQDQDINQLKRNMEAGLKEIKTKLSSKFKNFYDRLKINYTHLTPIVLCSRLHKYLSYFSRFRSTTLVFFLFCIGLVELVELGEFNWKQSSMSECY